MLGRHVAIGFGLAIAGTIVSTLFFKPAMILTNMQLEMQHTAEFLGSWQQVHFAQTFAYETIESLKTSIGMSKQTANGQTMFGILAIIYWAILRVKLLGVWFWPLTILFTGLLYDALKMRSRNKYRFVPYNAIIYNLCSHFFIAAIWLFFLYLISPWPIPYQFVLPIIAMAALPISGFIKHMPTGGR